MIIPHKNQSGFTIVELMIATVILATLLVLCASVSVQIGRLFYKGVSSSRTQEATRSITDQVVRNLQTSSTAPVGSPPGDPAAFCIDKTRYSYTLDKQASTSQHVLWLDQDADGACTPNLSAPNGRELMPQGMRLRAFAPTSTPDQLYWSIRISVALGADDVFKPDGSCVSYRSGGQFCDVAELNTGVYRALQ